MKILVQASDDSKSVWLDLSEHEETGFESFLDDPAEDWGADWHISEWGDSPVDFDEKPDWSEVFEWQGLINDFGFDMARAVSEFNVLPSEARELYVV